MPTADEIERLKRDWKDDPCWDLENTEGYEAYREELRAFRLATEAAWERQRQEREKALDAKADELGVRGLYRRLVQLEQIVERHRRAIQALGDGDHEGAYRALNGHVG